MSYEDSAKVADIGEGCRIIAQLTSAILNASVEARDFHAPEIIASRTWSKASDIFAFGVIVCQFLDWRVELCPDKAPKSAIIQTTDSSSNDHHDALSIRGQDEIVPLAVSEVIRSALTHDPTERGSIREYVKKFTELNEDVYAERVEPSTARTTWTTLNWWDVFDRAFSSEQRGSSTRPQHSTDTKESSSWTLFEATLSSEPL